MSKLLIAHGGAPTAVINASLYGAVQEARRSGRIDGILGADHGSGGILAERFHDLNALTDAELEAIRVSPASAIGTSRTPLEEADYEQMTRILQKHDIGYVLFTGGNGSMDTCARLGHACEGKGIVVGGIPKTIDNDIDLTDHAPGYGSAARFAAQSMAEIASDVAALPIHVCIVEYMGRNAGWITAASVLAREEAEDAPHMILLPEVPFEEEAFLKRVQELWQRGHGVVVAVSEGICRADGTPVAPPIFTAGRATYYGAVSQYLCGLVIQKLGIKSRYEVPGILGRCCDEMVSPLDRAEAEAMGALAARTVLSGKGGCMAALKRISDDPYQCEEILVPVEQLALRERMFPREWITEDGFGVTEAFARWCRPLLGGPLKRPFVWKERA